MSWRRRWWGPRGPDRPRPERASGLHRPPVRPDAEHDPPDPLMPFGAQSTLARVLTTRAIGLPGPEPLAVIRTHGPGWTAHGATPDDSTGWARVVARLPAAFSVRPVERTFGTRLAAFTRSGDLVRDQYGNEWTPHALVEQLMDAHDEEGWILEARMPDHPMLTRLVQDAGPMPAVVALTLLAPGGVPVLLSADLSVEPPGGPGGPRRHGPARELLRVDTATGRMIGRDARAILPDWGGLSALLARASRACPGTPALGWDVLLTTRGAMLAAVWSPWWTTVSPRHGHAVRAALQDRAAGRPPLGEPLILP